ncbi:MAG: hypothetical protein AAB778_01980 [Patescibacteria group bacterium]
MEIASKFREFQSNLYKNLWEIAESNPIATVTAVKIADTIIPMAEIYLSRRDFLKIGGIAAGATAAVLELPQIVEAQGIPTSITQTDQDIIDKFTKSAKTKGISSEQISAFTIRIGFSSWDFFAIAPTETVNSNGETITKDEQLFVRDIVFNPRGMAQLTSTRYVSLHKNVDQVAADGKTVITEWSMIKREPRPDKDQNDTKFERILWYPQLNDEQWKIVANDKTLSEFYSFMGFLPPSTTIGFFSNWGLQRETVDFYDPKTGNTIKKEAYTYPIDLANELPDGSKRSLIRRERVKISPESQLPAEVVEKFKETGIDPKEGTDESGKPIYFVTNPAGETVTVAIKNQEDKWELADSLKFKLFKTVEEAEASGQVMDTEYVLRGGPGQAAKLNGEPFSEDVITGLNIEVVKPNWKDPNSDQLNFDANSLSLLEENPNQAPYRLAGYFLYKNILNGVEQPGYGYVWQWINPDKSIVYITTIASFKLPDSYIMTPFSSFNLTQDLSAVAPIFDKIGHDEGINKLMLQWAETDVVPAELQDRALRVSYLFK